MIEKTKFGSITINGRKYGHDVIVTSEGKVKEARTVKRHLISKKELLDLIFERPDVVIIGTGQYGGMRISSEVTKFAEEKGLELIVLETKKAIEKFNSLAKEKKVAAYIHVTC